MWERGLKQCQTSVIANPPFVAPHVGAWIETLQMIHIINTLKSLPMWERGLKLLA